MNVYGQQAQGYWKRWLPERYAALPDPVGYFAELGEQVQRRVGDLWDGLVIADRAPERESHADRVGRLAALKRQAEEIVLAELVFLPPEPGAEPIEESGLEPDDSFSERLADFDARQQWRSQTSDALLDDRLTLDDLTDAELRDIVDYLSPEFLLAFGTSVEELRARGRLI
ncbi:hypothetical protein [Actinomadura rayongensis]|uniref:TnpV protein n=1 Tax=Actinomadura rayongensis TaxID=1429076 RepID=A0A6I4WFD2_9ACTN|nr:hypothetical protein [Actinomadura rayongensis]MXQ65644.1 hypothetical protein [Actinomadura rayongensis]